MEASDGFFHFQHKENLFDSFGVLTGDNGGLIEKRKNRHLPSFGNGLLGLSCLHQFFWSADLGMKDALLVIQTAPLRSRALRPSLCGVRV